jgi:hypothetical protein
MIRKEERKDTKSVESCHIPSLESLFIENNQGKLLGSLSIFKVYCDFQSKNKAYKLKAADS